jgi:cell division protein FtsN
MTGQKGLSPLFQVLIAILAFGVLSYALNYFGVINLWGKKVPEVIETLPEPEVMPPVTDTAQAMPEPTPLPTPPPAKAETPKPSVPPSTGGTYTVQVSSWMTPSKANEEAGRLSEAGLEAFVEESSLAGETWYRVRIGRYETQKDASLAAARLQHMLENGIWVARVGR